MFEFDLTMSLSVHRDLLGMCTHTEIFQDVSCFLSRIPGELCQQTGRKSTSDGIHPIFQAHKIRVRVIEMINKYRRSAA